MRGKADGEINDFPTFLLALAISMELETEHDMRPLHLNDVRFSWKSMYFRGQ